MINFVDAPGKRKACPICTAVTDKVLTETLRRGQGTVFYCGHCNLGFLDAKPFDVKSFYESAYRESVSHKAEAARTNAQEIFDIYAPFQRERLDLIEPHLKNKTQLLEIGASAGQFITHVIDKCERICAIELDADCARFLTEKFDVEVEADFLENSKFKEDQFDIVCAFQVLEHTIDPIAFMTSVYNATKPGGRAFVELPNLYDPLMSVWQVPGYQPFYYHSEHLFYFSSEALEDVSARAGFDREKMTVHFSQDYNLLNHLHWIMNNAPQATNQIGLSPVEVRGADDEMSDWLSAEMERLNAAYVKKLEASGRTSNLMIELVR